MPAGTADAQMKRLQSLRNTEARLVSGARRNHHVTPILHLYT